MTEPVTFRVLGLPAPQGSKTVYNGRPVEGGSQTGRENVKAWRNVVAETAHEVWAGRPPIDGPVSLSIKFVMPRPKAAPKKNRWHASRPDLDKLLRSTKDALKTAGVYTDDGRVACVTMTKTLATVDYPWTGATITICPLAHEHIPQEGGDYPLKSGHQPADT